MNSSADVKYMRRAIELAQRGEGHVEPNPMVGCVIAADDRAIGEGWHRQFGGPHAEIEALRSAGDLPHNATMYVTLEPCCHDGKTPPCTAAILASGVARVVIATLDPSPRVHGRGVEELNNGGVATEVGALQDAADQLIAPFRKLVTQQLPFVLAKWAMTLDGKIATRERSSRWISSPASRQIVHALRGRVDAVLVGRGTAEADDPLLTARPAGPRVPLRIVADSQANLSLSSQLVQTAGDYPVAVAVSEDAPPDRLSQLMAHQVQIIPCSGTSHAQRLMALLRELARRNMTNLLVEGGGALLGCLMDLRAIDEVHVFVAPQMVGGSEAISPLGGHGLATMAEALRMRAPEIQLLEHDVYVAGRVAPEDAVPRPVE